MEGNRESFRESVASCHRSVSMWCDHVRAQRVSSANNLLPAVLANIEAVLPYPQVQDVSETITECLSSFLSAYGDKDYILAVDYMESGVLRILEDVAQRSFREYPMPYAADGYEIEITSIGAYTLAKQMGDKRIYLHSNHDPYREGERYAERWIREGAAAYHIAGLGFGYHVERLSLRSFLQVNVYEEEDTLIELFQRYSDVWPLLKERENVRIIPDPGYRKFVRKAAEIEEGEGNERICLWHPSLQTIRDPALREKMQALFLQMDNAERWANLMRINFMSNVKHVTEGTDRVRANFAGRTVYVVAGGPSLDRNIHRLKEKGRDDIIFAVGTSLRRCLLEGVRPDYAIITDPKPPVHDQIKGIEDCGVPLLLLSTSYMGVAEDYRGEKFLMCQKGYRQAEMLAGERGWEIFETGGSVVTTALDFCIRSDVSSVVFLGLDLAFTDGRSHQGLKEKIWLPGESGIFVTDIYGNQTATSVNLNSYRLWIEKRIARAGQEGCRIKFIDASEGGARVEGTVLMTLEEAMRDRDTD